jgi:hypothetical protein
MSEYKHLPSRVMPNSFILGANIFCQYHLRILGGKFGSIDKRIEVAAFAEGGYCLDAPQLLPGGGCYYLEFGPHNEDGTVDWCVDQWTIDREHGPI